MDAAYLAGIIDGEGCISIYKRNGYYVPSISISNTNETLIVHIKKILDQNNIGYCVEFQHRKERGNRKPAWLIRIESRPRVISLLNFVFPYLVGKLSQAKLVYEFCQTDGRKEEYINIEETITDIRSLNKRGSSYEATESLH